MPVAQTSTVNFSRARICVSLLLPSAYLDTTEWNEGYSNSRVILPTRFRGHFKEASSVRTPCNRRQNLPPLSSPSSSPFPPQPSHCQVSIENLTKMRRNQSMSLEQKRFLHQYTRNSDDTRKIAITGGTCVSVPGFIRRPVSLPLGNCDSIAFHVPSDSPPVDDGPHDATHATFLQCLQARTGRVNAAADRRRWSGAHSLTGRTGQWPSNSRTYLSVTPAAKPLGTSSQSSRTLEVTESTLGVCLACALPLTA